MRNIYLILFILIFIVIFLFSDSNNKEFIDQEAIPVRKNDIIIGMDYIFKINGIRNRRVILKSDVLDSINHYKDINNISDFLVSLRVEDNTKYKYIIRNISLVNNSGVIVNKLNYKNNSSYNTYEIELNKEIVSYYRAGYDIQIELER